jgi:hypothetical protein
LIWRRASRGMKKMTEHNKKGQGSAPWIGNELIQIKISKEFSFFE